MRPKTFNSIVGQKRAKIILSKAIESANERRDAVPHILLSGPAGTGKTTLAAAVGVELGEEVLFANGANMTNPRCILPYLSKVKHRGIIFIDEIHRIRKNIQELLFTVMEDFRLDIGKRAKASISYDPFTIIGATTDAGMLLKPFRDRFVYNVTLTKYDEREMAQIVLSYSQKLGVRIPEKGIYNLAGRCRGIPRLAVNYVKWIRDYSISEGMSSPTIIDLDKAMSIIGVDEDGMTEDDRRYISVLKKFGKPVGLKTLSAALTIDEQTIESVIEPFLISKGLLLKTSSGRQLV